MQYWKPDATDEFAGDMMPFWDGKRFHLFYLLDRDHHAEQDGLGGHQWAHASTLDLRLWQHHPLAVPIGQPGEADQHGICTGSILKHAEVYHAFYATRIRRDDGSVFEALCRAQGSDLIHFQKSASNPFMSAPDSMDANNFRDPFVFFHPETNRFHMFVTASSAGRGVIAHFSSPDLMDWQAEESPVPPGDDHHAPECPELFEWNGWWYLLYGHSGQGEYFVSRAPLGPWQRAKRRVFEAPTLVVPRTASIGNGRRLAVGFLQWRRDERDEGERVYAGNAVFRELLQDPDGTLWTRFVPEMMPATGPLISYKVEHTDGQAEGNAIEVKAAEEAHFARVSGVPADAVLKLRLEVARGTREYGLLLRADESLQSGYLLRFAPGENTVSLARLGDQNEPLAVVRDAPGLDEGADVVICLQGSIVDVCIGGRHTLIERGFDHQGHNLGVWAKEGQVRVEELEIAPLIESRT